MALQKRIINDRYKPLEKSWLIDNKVRVLIDGVDTTDMSIEELNGSFRDYDTFEIYQYSTREKRYVLHRAVPNLIRHPKGLIGYSCYMQVGISYGPKGGRRSISIPLHRIVYVWFNDVILPYNENKEKMEILHNDGHWYNNHISNLSWDTAKKNRAQRGGFVNQWGPRKKKANEQQNETQNTVHILG